MQKYPVRPTHRRNLDAAPLAALARDCFGDAASDGTSVTAKWGAIERLSVRADGRELAVDLVMNPKVPEAVAAETIARYNRFLEAVTGYGSKERARRLRKSVTASDSG